MSGTFVHHVEMPPVVSDGNRQLDVSGGDVNGLHLAYIGLAADCQRVGTVLTLDEVRALVVRLQSLDPAHYERSRGYYLYRVVITSYPEGALYFYDGGDGDQYGEPDLTWRPDGWQPDAEWLDRFGDKFFWPSTKFEYKSKSSAQSRAKLIESYGATAKVVQSSLITWPTEGES